MGVYIRAARLAIVASGLAALTGCSVLVDFIDQPLDDGTCDGSSCDASIDASDASDVTVKDAFVPDVRDAGPPDVATLCKGKANGWYCGFNGLNGTAPSKDDLVECHDGGVFMLTLCDGGCLAYPNGVPDQCNECGSMKDGYYCGNQFPNAAPGTNTVLVLCTKGTGIVEQDCPPKMCVPGPNGTASCK